jgi:hypothetical protein
MNVRKMLGSRTMEVPRKKLGLRTMEVPRKKIGVENYGSVTEGGSVHEA